MVDSHTIATFAFAQLERDPDFHGQFGWVRNTVVCVESDLADDVLSGQMLHYFPDGGTIACYYPREQRFVFVRVAAPQKASSTGPALPDAPFTAHDKHRKLTVGMLIDAMYPDWSQLRRFSYEQMVGEVSTVEVEKQLVLR
ncbi:hypothetical protein F0Q45_20825 [Mycobacterium simiae]|uniref:Uncharacterized protein n=1 Tax=Mycobacterium simiae TaxID=1784 RepID=A0A5B1BK92_MYCSI|nr:hypothetical protein [Mycobacterium simiae]KAA1248391.1 hypothetical protein F0Q45_20825 [Mycobacterium simiae]